MNVLAHLDRKAAVCRFRLKHPIALVGLARSIGRLNAGVALMRNLRCFVPLKQAHGLIDGNAVCIELRLLRT